MFYLLCISFCFAAMFMVTAGTSTVLLPLLRLVLARSDKLRSATTANLIFFGRALPAVLGLIATLGLALPAFLEFEPSSTIETPGFLLLILAGLGALIVAAILVRSWRILRTTHVMQKNWLHQAERLSISGNDLPVYRVEQPGLLLAVTGIFRPRIFISRDVAGVLDGPELQAALAHELSHIRGGDNLKQFVLKVTRPPHRLRFLGELDSAWASISEVAADEGAITRGASALDLASALIKVARLSNDCHSPTRLAASHLVDRCGAATQTRARRLRELLENASALNSSEIAAPPAYAPAVLATLLLVYAALLSSLPAIHDVLEFLVR